MWGGEDGQGSRSKYEDSDETFVSVTVANLTSGRRRSGDLVASTAKFASMTF